ncbi:MAG: hypothetical protein ACI9G1_003068, partial [Pirellulaceae bacterium]
DTLAVEEDPKKNRVRRIATEFFARNREIICRFFRPAGWCKRVRNGT